MPLLTATHLDAAAHMLDAAMPLLAGAAHLLDANIPLPAAVVTTVHLLSATVLPHLRNDGELIIALAPPFFPVSGGSQQLDLPPVLFFRSLLH